MQEISAEELKNFCKEHKMTYKELALILGISEGGLLNALSSEKISKSVSAAFILYKKLLEAERKLQDYEQLRTLLLKLLK